MKRNVKSKKKKEKKWARKVKKQIEFTEKNN